MKTIEEKNRIVAEFMGRDKTGSDVTWTSPPYLKGDFWVDEHFFNGTDDYCGRRQTSVSEMKFNSSWEWLMIVASEISSELSEDMTSFIECENFNGVVLYYGDLYLGYSVDTAFDEIVSIIEWYNKNKES